MKFIPLYSLLASLLGCALGKLQHSCISSTELFGLHKKSEAEKLGPHSEGIMHSDLSQLQSLPLVQVAFSRLKWLMVCADSEYVYGVQTATRMHEVEEKDYLDEGLDPEIISVLDQMPDLTTHNAFSDSELKLIGSQTQPCSKLTLDDEDKIMKITVYSDGDRLRTLHILKASGETQTFGSKTYKRPNHSLHEHVYDFGDKEDLLGVYGHVGHEPHEEHKQPFLKSIGFIVNKCPVRSALEFEKKFIENRKTILKVEHTAGKKKFEKDDPVILKIGFVLLSISCVALSIYLCHKVLRKMNCKKRRAPKKEAQLPEDYEFVHGTLQTEIDSAAERIPTEPVQMD